MITSSIEGTILTYTGRRMSLIDPNPEDINVLDIIHHLSHLCRFAGAVREFYSVAEHSCRVHDFLKSIYFDDPVILLWGLLHDASEAYLVDIPRNFKYTEQMLPYRIAEEKMMQAVCKKLNLPLIEPAAVKFADNTILVTEQRDLMPKGSIVLKDYEPLTQRISPWTSVVAKSGMMERLEKLGIEVKR